MELGEIDLTELRSVLRREGYNGSVAARAQLVLWRAEGYSAAQVAAMAGTSLPTVYKWVARYAEFGLAGLSDLPRPGRPRSVSGEVRSQILALTRSSPPVETGLSHWSSRTLADYLKRARGIDVSHNFIAELWAEYDLQPYRQGTFKLSTDPEFEAKVTDVVGLYLDPPDGAVVLSVDEKTQIQALDRTQPVLPITFGRTEKRTHDYVRHGTTNLFAALNVATGEVVGECFPRRRTKEFIAFLDRVVGLYGDRELHVVLDNLSTHIGGDVDVWLTKNPNVTFHFTPKGSSWLNQIELWFGIITRQAIRRGTFTSLRTLINAINNYIETWNADAKPFTWTAKSGEIIAKVRFIQREFKKYIANNARKGISITIH